MVIQYHGFFWLARLLMSPILVFIIIRTWQRMNRLYQLFTYPILIMLSYNFLCWVISFAGCRWLAPGFDGRNRNLYNTIIYESTLVNLVVCIITILFVFGLLYYRQDRFSKQKTLDLEVSLEDLRSELMIMQNKITSNQGDKLPGTIAVKNGHRTMLVPLEEITCIRSKGVYISIVTENGNYLLKKPLSEMEKTLPGAFLRVHRSSIVNTKFIKEMRSLLNGDGCLVLKDATEIRLSRTYRDQVVKNLRGL